MPKSLASPQLFALIQDHRLESKGFYDEVTLGDFSLSGKAYFLQIENGSVSSVLAAQCR